MKMNRFNYYNVDLCDTYIYMYIETNVTIEITQQKLEQI